jgi:hypothetical protein
MRQEDCEFEAIQGCTGNSKKKKTKLGEMR